MKKTANWLWGCVLIALGIVLGINALGLARINIFFPGWWTLFIIVPCVIAILTDEHKGGPLFGLAIGICLLLSCLGILPFGILWKLIIPVGLILIGLAVLAQGASDGEVADKIRAAREEQRKERRRERHIAEAEVVEDDDEDDFHDGLEEYWSTFGDQDVNYDGKEFKGCRVDAVFGRANVDLRKAKIMDKAILRTSSVFGKIVVLAPEDVKVEIASTAIFGGVADRRQISEAKADDKAKKADDKKDAKTDNKRKVLYIDSNCVFGNVELK